MSNTRSFEDFDNPEASTPIAGPDEAGVLLTDTLEDLREKTNGIVEKVKAIDGAYVVADNIIKEGGLNTNKLALDKIVKTTARRLLGNAQATDTDVTEIPIATSSGFNSGSDFGIQGEDATTVGVPSIPTSNAVKTYVDDKINLKLDSSTFTAFESKAATTHFINAWATTTPVNQGPSAANLAYIAAILKGVVEVGHHVFARVRQYHSWGNGNGGTSYGHRQLFVVLNVASLQTDGTPEFTYASGLFL